MDAVQTNSHKQDYYIRKSNLWKFFKTLRVQANSIYCLLVASPIHYAWINISDREDSTNKQRISIAQFVNSLKTMPSTDKHYQLSIQLYDPSAPSANRRSTYVAILQHELSLERVCGMLPSIMAFHCEESAVQGIPFELTPQTVGHYKFKSRYIEELQTIIDNYNSRRISKTIKLS